MNEAVDERTDVQFMEEFEKWPRWPMCPVKRKNAETGQREVGILWADGEPIVYLVNMFNLPADLGAAPQLNYESFQDIVDDGWRVD